jgi:hypothetical protein
MLLTGLERRLPAQIGRDLYIITKVILSRYFPTSYDTRNQYGHARTEPNLVFGSSYRSRTWSLVLTIDARRILRMPPSPWDPLDSIELEACLSQSKWSFSKELLN